ncbi:MAG: hemerythrin domain-containing protein [Magnetospirillum sp.]|nr:hemerythrin domain-containing protein [Magnetospirillum sp.]
MSTWRNEEWQSGDPAMDTEHQKLHQMASSMTAVVMNDPGLGLATEAVDVLRERMRLHFRMEEQALARTDPESASILKEDHARLLLLLGRVRDALADGGIEDCKHLLTEFNTAMDKHDREVDIPLFRMQNKGKRDPLAS